MPPLTIEDSKGPTIRLVVGKVGPDSGGGGRRRSVREPSLNGEFLLKRLIERDLKKLGYLHGPVFTSWDDENHYEIHGLIDVSILSSGTNY